MLAVSCSRNARCEAVNTLSDRQLDHRFYAIFEKNWQHNYAPRHGLEQSRADRNGVGRHLGDQHALLFSGALSNEPCPYVQTSGMAIVIAISEGR